MEGAGLADAEAVLRFTERSWRRNRALVRVWWRQRFADVLYQHIAFSQEELRGFCEVTERTDTFYEIGSVERFVEVGVRAGVVLR